jgi:hypothetical protein
LEEPKSSEIIRTGFSIVLTVQLKNCLALSEIISRTIRAFAKNTAENESRDRYIGAEISEITLRRDSIKKIMNIKNMARQ